MRGWNENPSEHYFERKLKADETAVAAILRREAEFATSVTTRGACVPIIEVRASEDDADSAVVTAGLEAGSTAVADSAVVVAKAEQQQQQQQQWQQRQRVNQSTVILTCTTLMQRLFLDRRSVLLAPPQSRIQLRRS